MDVINSTFTSVKAKRQKVFGGKEQKFMYVPKISKTKPTGVNELEGEAHSGLFKFSSQELHKLANPVLEEAFDELDLSSLGNT